MLIEFGTKFVQVCWKQARDAFEEISCAGKRLYPEVDWGHTRKSTNGRCSRGCMQNPRSISYSASHCAGSMRTILNPTCIVLFVILTSASCKGVSIVEPSFEVDRQSNRGLSYRVSHLVSMERLIRRTGKQWHPSLRPCWAGENQPHTLPLFACFGALNCWNVFSTMCWS